MAAIPMNQLGQDAAVLAPQATTHTDAFIEREGRNLHPALDPQHRALMEKYPQTPVSAIEALDTKLYTEDFKAVLKAYAVDQADPKIRALITYQEDHGWKESSWAEVFESFRKAEEEYQRLDNQKLRKFGRKLNEHAASVLPYLRMIPNDMHFAVLSGGMRVIVEAAARLNTKREEILLSIIRIPCAIVKAESFTQNFCKDPFVLAQAEQLYVHALVALQGTMQWLCAGPKAKPFWAVLRGPLYNQDFDSKMKQLNQSLDALEMHVGAARDRALVRVDSGVEGIQRSLTDFSTIHDQSQTEMQVAVQKLTGTVGSLAESKEKKDAEDAKNLLEASKEAIEHLKKVLGDTNSTAKWMQRRDRDLNVLTARIEELERAGMALTIDDVLEIVDVGRTSSISDLRKILNAVPEASESINAVSAAQNPTFKEWQEGDRSSALFMEQSHGSLSSRWLSSMSILSSNFVGSLQDNRRATCIHFFCGLHTSSHDRLGGPSGVVRSLLEQVLRLFPVQLDFFSLRLKQQLEKLEFRALCECFSRVIRSLPLTTVLFCVVDSVNFLDKSVWTNDLQHLLEVLLNLTEDYTLSAAFKVLVTTPVRTRYVRDMFPSELRLAINVERGARGGLTDRQLAEASRRPRRLPQRELRAALEPRTQDLESDEDWTS